MAEPIVRRYADAEQVSRAAAAEFVRLAQAGMKAGVFTVALSGGSTPRRLYQLLADKPFADQVDWPRVEFFWGDERCVPPGHPDSNYRMAREALLSKLSIPGLRVHRMQAERPDRDAAAREYEAEIRLVHNLEPPDENASGLDLVFLGMGPDGHTASLFPHTEALKESTRWVVPNFVPKFDTYRLTMTYPILNRAANVLFLVAGADKADVLAEVLEGPPDPDRLPSQRIRPAGRLVWLVDRAAAAKLTRTPVEGE